MSRTCSASRPSANGVKPTRSANSTDTRRRSAVVTEGGALVAAAVSEAVAVVPSAVPHLPQKRASGRLGSPQWAHVAASGLPQLSQKRPPAGFSAPQFEQFMIGWPSRVSVLDPDRLRAASHQTYPSALDFE